MYVTKTAVFICLLIVAVVVSLTASYFGFTLVNDMSFGMTNFSNDTASGIASFLSLLWGMAVFMFTMCFFAIKNVPAIFSVLWDVMGIIELYILLTSFNINILGTGGGGSGSD